MITKKDVSKLEGLIYLHALAKTNSKREVAEKLGTSVDTINKYISDLENDMKTIFLMTSGRGTVITPEGEKIIKISECLMHTIRSLESYDEMASSCKGTVRVSMPDAVSCLFGSKCLVDFLEKYPEIHVVSLIQNETPDMQNLEADIALSFEAPIDPDVVLLVSKNVPISLYASESYIQKFGKPKDIEDLINNHRICNKDHNERYIAGWQEVLEKAKNLVFRNNSAFAYRAAMTAGMGVGICFPYDVESNMVKIDTIKDFDSHLKVHLIAHKDTKDMPRIRTMIDFYKDLLENTKK